MGFTVCRTLLKTSFMYTIRWSSSCCCHVENLCVVASRRLGKAFSQLLFQTFCKQKTFCCFSYSDMWSEQCSWMIVLTVAVTVKLALNITDFILSQLHIYTQWQHLHLTFAVSWWCHQQCHVMSLTSVMTKEYQMSANRQTMHQYNCVVV